MATSSSSSSSTSSSSGTIQWKHGCTAALQRSVEEFNTFLRQTKADLESRLNSSSDSDGNANAVVHVYVGNEAADADSIVSSLVYAFYNYNTNKKKTQTDHSCVYVPVLPIPRNELKLRGDVSSLFRELKIAEDAIWFVDEFPWKHPKFTSKQITLRLTLLDHNALNNKKIQANGEKEVGEIVEIIDHHMDLGQHSSANVREIAFKDGNALVASNCTLVAENILQENNNHIDPLSATLLLSVIALDSVNFDPSAKKVTPRDVLIAKQLEPTAFASKEALFNWLNKEKSNTAHWDSFTIKDCLRCDYKEFDLPMEGTGKYGVASILISLDKFLKKVKDGEAFVEELQRYCEENHLTFLVVMTVFTINSGERKRQVLFYEPNDDLHFIRQCKDFLMKENTLQLECLELPLTHQQSHLIAFNQLNIGASRKQVVPLIQEALTLQ